MTDTAASSSKGSPSEKEAPRRGFFGRIMLFIRQVFAELGKVVTPTRRELVRFTITVLVFVIIMMLIVTGLDLLFGAGALWVFGGS
ncbi:preprotein translocase subunit SecE [Arthrobacter sp. Ld5]|uniref:preprotein translocase subunit SecE n=1 Tax=Arthrobacter sp. Ld5 TaxID=649152 RepID=UPI003EBCCC86